MTRPMPLAFSDAEFARRLHGVRARMRTASLDTLLVVAAENIRTPPGTDDRHSNFGVLMVRHAGRSLHPRDGRTVAGRDLAPGLRSSQRPTRSSRRRSPGAGGSTGASGWKLGESLRVADHGSVPASLGQTVDGTGLVEAGRASPRRALIHKRAASQAGPPPRSRRSRRRHGERRVQRRLRRDDGGGLRFLRRRPDRDLGLAVRRRAPHVRQPATRARRHDPARAERLPAPVLRAAHAGGRHRAGTRRGSPDVRRHHRGVGGGDQGDPAGCDQRGRGRCLPGADRARRLRAELPEAHRILGRCRLCAELGRGAHRESSARRSDATRARDGLSHAARSSRVAPVRPRLQRDGPGDADRLRGADEPSPPPPRGGDQIGTRRRARGASTAATGRRPTFWWSAAAWLRSARRGALAKRAPACWWR